VQGEIGKKNDGRPLEEQSLGCESATIISSRNPRLMLPESLSALLRVFQNCFTTPVYTEVSAGCR
jgi:hypothetical protein